MNILRFDSVGGASGDMILGALIDLGADPGALRAELRSLGIESFELDAQVTAADGLRGTRVTVTVPDAHHPHRHLSDIRAIIEAGRLDPAVKKLSLHVFERLAAAEAAVHGTTPEAIHFHEVGAMDAIVDVTGACLALTQLRIDAIRLSPLPIGSGSVRCAHGVMPLPVPATAELLKGFAVSQTDEPFELVTPTGAALLTTWCSALPAPAGSAECILQRTGTGIGHRKLNGRPNILRASLLTPATSASPTESCTVLECNVDDMNPELLGSLGARALEAGAWDVFMTPVQMKKQRPGTLLTILCRPEDRDRFVDLVFAETTSFGIREHRVSRTVLERRHETVDTVYGPVRIKIGSRHGQDITRSPEHADCAKCAERHGIPVRTVYEAALRDATRTA